jgi:DNA integrity scanning protein DisA with diadenylate cyclase activity
MKGTSNFSDAHRIQSILQIFENVSNILRKMSVLHLPRNFNAMQVHFNVTVHQTINFMVINLLRNYFMASTICSIM